MAVASRANMPTGIDLMTKLGATLAGQREITSLLAFTNRPAFVFSYEKMMTAPDPILSCGRWHLSSARPRPKRRP